MSVLTAKQEQFVRCIIEGMSQADAYRTAYKAENMTDNSIYCESSKLMSDPKIAQRVAELRADVARASVMSAQERLEWLTKVVKDEVPDYKDGIESRPDLNTKIRAVDTMNKMTGEYTTKIEGDIKVKKLEDLL